MIEKKWYFLFLTTKTATAFKDICWHIIIVGSVLAV